MLKICNIATRMNLQEARATPHIRSKPIHRPQGNLSLRFVAPPSPYITRRYVAYSPLTMMAANMARQTVILGTCNFICADLLPGPLRPGGGGPPDAAQYHRSRRNYVRHQLQHPPRGLRQRFHRHVRAQPDLLERYCGKVEHARAADFLHPVDLVVVAAWLLRDPLVRFRQQLVPLAAYRGAHRTGFRARRLLARALPLVAHVALAHLRQPLVPLVGRHLEWTGLHAVTATHALVRVVGHRSQRGLLQCTHRTDRSARRLLAIHAQAAAV